MKKRAVFIDRDGVVNRAVPREGYAKPTAPFTFEELFIFDHVKEALTLLKRKGFLSILVTNQPDIAYGNMKQEEYDKIHKKIEALGFDDICVCFHGRGEGCDCKKPKPGMLHAAAKKWDIDLAHSFMVGDTETDMGAGSAAGVRTILVETDYNTGVPHDHKVKDLLHAAMMVAHRVRS